MLERPIVLMFETYILIYKFQMDLLDMYLGNFEYYLIFLIIITYILIYKFQMDQLDMYLGNFEYYLIFLII